MTFPPEEQWIVERTGVVASALQAFEQRKRLGILGSDECVSEECARILFCTWMSAGHYYLNNGCSADVRIGMQRVRELLNNLVTDVGEVTGRALPPYTEEAVETWRRF